MRGNLLETFRSESDATDAALWRAVIGGGESRVGHYTGTKALMLAVLEDAMRGYLSPVATVRAEAEFWLTTRCHPSPFAFTVICDVLGLEPEAVLSALKRMRERNVSARRAIRRSRPNVRRPGRLVTRRAG